MTINTKVILALHHSTFISECDESSDEFQISNENGNDGDIIESV